MGGRGDETGPAELGAPEPGEPSPSDRFWREAQRAGLQTPPSGGARVGVSIALVVVVVVAGFGVGYLTGWTNLGTAGTSGVPLLYGPQNCPAVPVQLGVGSADSVDPALTGWLRSTVAGIVNSTGGCLDLSFPSTSSSDPAAALTALDSDALFLSFVPNASEEAGLTSPLGVTPVAVGAVAVVYNVPELADPLHLNGSVLGAVLSGGLTQWNAAPIGTLNPGEPLPDSLSIAPVTQVEPSEATQAVAQYIGQADPGWAARYGDGPTVDWPAGVGVGTSSQVIEKVAATPGAIGYVQLTNATPLDLPVAALEDPAGDFVAPTPHAATLAAEAVVAPANGSLTSNLSLVDTSPASGYPILDAGYLAIFDDLGVGFAGSLNLTSASWLMTVLWWLSESTAYVPLPLALQAGTSSVLTNVTFNGQKILQVQDSEGSEGGGETGEF